MHLLNIAHGCGSIIATKLALKLADSTRNWSRFSATDLNWKFLILNVKTNIINLFDFSRIIKLIKYHGLENLEKHTAKI